MAKMPVVKTRALVRVLERLGFYRHHQVGSHAHFKLAGVITDIDMSVEEFTKALKGK